MKKTIVIAILLAASFGMQAQLFQPFGGCFTPKDSLRVLMLFVGFGPEFDTSHTIAG